MAKICRIHYFINLYHTINLQFILRAAFEPKKSLFMLSKRKPIMAKITINIVSQNCFLLQSHFYRQTCFNHRSGGYTINTCLPEIGEIAEVFDSTDYILCKQYNYWANLLSFFSLEYLFYLH